LTLLEPEDGSDRAAREAEVAAVEADTDDVGRFIRADVAEVPIVGSDAEVRIGESINTKPHAVAKIIVLDGIDTVHREIASDQSESCGPVRPEPRSTLASDRHTENEGGHQREDVVVAEAGITAVKVPGVGQVYLGAENALDRPADVSTPGEAATVIERLAQ